MMALPALLVSGHPSGLPDGLWIQGGDSPNLGTTIITVRYVGLTATGSITFWAK